jgi:hypothetical protein
MFFLIIMALVTRIHLLTAAEPKPSVTLWIVSTATAFRQLSAGLKTEGFFLAAWAGGGRETVWGGDAKEFDRGELEGELLMAFSADVAGRFALDADDAW